MMRVHIEIDDAAASYVFGMCMTKLRSHKVTADEKVLVSHLADTIRVGIEVARTAKYTQTAERPPLIEPAPV